MKTHIVICDTQSVCRCYGMYFRTLQFISPPRPHTQYVYILNQPCAF